MKHLQPKRRKSTIAGNAVSPNILSEVAVELNMGLSRSFICRVFVLLATTAIASATPVALAQEQAESRHVSSGEIAWNEQRFLIESDLAMGKMSLGMTAEPSGDVDGDFVAMMTAQQQGAMDIASAELKYGHNEELRRLARDMIAAREHEVSVMRGAVEEATSAQSIDTPKTMAGHARAKQERTKPPERHIERTP
jgi:hypothetical protein